MALKDHVSRDQPSQEFTTTEPGAVPAPGASAGKYLKDDGTWDTPAGGGGGTPAKYLELLASTSTGSFTTTWTDVPFATISEDSGGDFTRSGAEITCNVDEIVEVSFSITCNQVSGNSRSEWGCRLLVNGVEELGFGGYVYSRNSSQDGGTVTKNRLLTVSSGDVLKVQVQRRAGSGTFATVANLCNFKINTLGTGGSGGSGEANTTSSAGGTESLVLPKSGVDLPFKGLTAGSNITLTPGANDITIAATGGGGSGDANIMRFRFNPTVVGFADPGNGKFLFSSGEAQMSVDDLTDAGADVSSFLEAMTIGDRLLLTQANDVTKYRVILLNGILISGFGYTTFFTNVEASNGTFDNDAEVIFQFVPTSRPQGYVETAVAGIGTTSTTNVLATGMSITPIAGRYLVKFGAVMTTDSSTNRIAYIRLYYDGSPISEEAYIERGDASTDNRSGCIVQGIVTVDGATAIEGRWRTSGSTAFMYGRSISAIRIE